MLKDKQELRIPGPVPVPPKVLLATAQPMVNHRGEEFKKLMPQLLERLKPVFATKNPIYCLTGSGTAAMEAAVANTVSPGDAVLVLVGGSFGQRWAEICNRYKAKVIELPYPWGQGVDPQAVRDMLAKHPEVVAIFATHNESSTSVLNDIQGISKAKAGHDALLIVDAVSSLGGTTLETDLWEIDIVCTASQKCLLVPPGLAFVSVSDKARKRMEQVTSPRYYFDLIEYEKWLEKSETPFTPNISNYFALEQALDMIEAEGVESILARHLLMRDMVRAGIRALEMPLLVEEQWASPTVTGIKPAGIDANKFRATIQERYGVEFAGGQGKLAGQIFRIGHMGYATPLDMLTSLAAIESYLGKYGVATAAAEQVWEERRK